ncbi:hypothetical protein MNBD_ACTINO02-808 [hydrothermal vent metagenome]|uniref:Uncharacterized protein n=1 Tax=hydrothermal vent metagenome TaxID=652676 RepID=A0A3B0SP04_9ZZZZ
MSERPAIVQIIESTESDVQTRVVITLGWSDEEFHGESVGSSSPTSRPRLVGEATLRAVEAVTSDRLQLSLAAVATTDLGVGQVAMAQVLMVGDAEPLVGSSLVRSDDEAAATVRAVLDALNRRIATVL